MKKYVILATMCAVAVFALALAQAGHDSTRQGIGAAEWTLSADTPPPLETPFVGYWIKDCRPIPVTVVEIGTHYYEYTAGGGTARAQLIYEDAPLYWIQLPGGAR
jgi:hypothetical protein